MVRPGQIPPNSNPTPPKTPPKGNSGTDNKNVHVSQTQKYKYDSGGKPLGNVSDSKKPVVTGTKGSGEIVYETKEQFEARQSYLKTGTGNVQRVTPTGVAVFGPAQSDAGYVEAERQRIAAKYPGYTAPNQQLQTENIIRKINPQAIKEPSKYPYYTGPRPSQPFVAQGVVPDDGGIVRTPFGPSVAKLQTEFTDWVVGANRVAFGGGMGGEYIPGEEVTRFGAENLFERRARRLEEQRTGEPMLRPTVTYKGGATAKAIAAEPELIGAIPSRGGVVFTGPLTGWDANQSEFGEGFKSVSGVKSGEIWDTGTFSHGFSGLGVSSGSFWSKQPSEKTTPAFVSKTPTTQTPKDKVVMMGVGGEAIPAIQRLANIGLGGYLKLTGTSPKYSDYTQQYFGISEEEFYKMPYLLQMAADERARALNTGLPLGREKFILSEGEKQRSEYVSESRKALGVLNAAIYEKEGVSVYRPSGMIGVTDSSGKLVTDIGELRKLRGEVITGLKEVPDKITESAKQRVKYEQSYAGSTLSEIGRGAGSVYINALIGAEVGFGIGGPAGAAVGGAGGGLLGLAGYSAFKEAGRSVTWGVTKYSKPVIEAATGDKFIADVGSGILGSGTGKIYRGTAEILSPIGTSPIVGGFIETGVGLKQFATSQSAVFAGNVGGVRVGVVKGGGQVVGAVATKSRIIFSAGSKGAGFGDAGITPFTQAAKEGAVYMPEASSKTANELQTLVLFKSAAKDPMFSASELARAKYGIEAAGKLEYQPSMYKRAFDIIDAKNMGVMPEAAVKNFRGVLEKYSERGDILFRYKGSLTNIAQMSPTSVEALKKVDLGEAKDVDIEIIPTPYGGITGQQLRAELVEAGVKGGAKVSVKDIGILAQTREGPVKIFDVMDAGDVSVEKGTAGGKYRAGGLDVDQGYLLLGGKPAQPLSEGNIRYLSTITSFQTKGGLGFTNPESFREKDIYRFQLGSMPTLIESAKANPLTYVKGVEAERLFEKFKSMRGEDITKPVYDESILKSVNERAKKVSGFSKLQKETFDFVKNEDAVIGGSSAVEYALNLKGASLGRQIGDIDFYVKDASMQKPFGEKLYNFYKSRGVDAVLEFGEKGKPFLKTKDGLTIADVGVIRSKDKVINYDGLKVIDFRNIVTDWKFSVKDKSEKASTKKAQRLRDIRNVENVMRWKPFKTSTVGFGKITPENLGDVTGGDSFLEKMFKQKESSYYASKAAYGKMGYNKMTYGVPSSTGGSNVGYSSTGYSTPSYSPQYSKPYSSEGSSGGYTPYKPDYSGGGKYTYDISYYKYNYKPDYYYPGGYGYSSYRYDYNAYSSSTYTRFNPPFGRLPLGSSLPGGGKSRWKWQKFVPSFVPSGRAVADWMGGDVSGATVRKRRKSKKKKRR